MRENYRTAYFFLGVLGLGSGQASVFPVVRNRNRNRVVNHSVTDFPKSGPNRRKPQKMGCNALSWVCFCCGLSTWCLRVCVCRAAYADVHTAASRQQDVCCFRAFNFEGFRSWSGKICGSNRIGLIVRPSRDSLELFVSSFPSLRPCFCTPERVGETIR